ncbi:MAG: DUF1573 domain-containing protein [Verrucomicrobia bacterium]|nr:DUF1573 domain-containing protein [Verrucomicrobiota bacterium]
MLSLFRQQLLIGYGLLAAFAVGQVEGIVEGNLKFTQSSADVGFVSPTNAISRSFAFEVSGKKEMSIVKTASNCGCSAVAVEKRKYKAGEKGVVRMDLDPRGFVGPFRKEAYIQDSNGKLHLLEIHGIAPGMKDMDSKGNFNAVPKGTMVTNHFQIAIYSAEKIVQPSIASDEPQKFVIQEIRQNAATNFGECFVTQVAFDVVAQGDQLAPGLNRSLIRCGLKDHPGYATTIGVLAKGHQDYEVIPDVLYVRPNASKTAEDHPKLGPILIRIELVGKTPQVTDVRLGNQIPKWDVMEQEKNCVTIRLLNLPDLLKLDTESTALRLLLKGETIEIPVRRLSL